MDRLISGDADLHARFHEAVALAEANNLLDVDSFARIAAEIYGARIPEHVAIAIRLARNGVRRGHDRDFGGTPAWRLPERTGVEIETAKRKIDGKEQAVTVPKFTP